MIIKDLNTAKYEEKNVRKVKDKSLKNCVIFYIITPYI